MKIKSPQTPEIALPYYKHAPPTGQVALAWGWFFLRPHARGALFCFLTNLVRQSFFKSIPLLLGILVGLAESGRGITHPGLMVKWITLYAVLNFAAFAALAVIMPAGFIIDTVSRQLSLFAFRHYLALPEAWHESRASGEKLQRLLTARQSCFDLLENIFWHVNTILAAGVAVFFSVIILKAPFYYILMFYGLIISYLALSHVTAGWMKRRYAVYYAALERVIGGVYEFLVSTATIRFFNLKNHIMSKAGILEGDGQTARMQVFKMTWIRWTLMDCTALLWMTAIIALASWEIVHKDLSAASYATIIFMTLTIWYELENFAIVYARMIEQWEGFKRLVEILNIASSIIDDKDPQSLPRGLPEICLKNVTFRYHEDSALVESLDLHIAPQEKIGLIGPSGAGKTTIVKLLLRFYDTDEGSIKIGGVDIKRLGLEALQSSIAVIPQDVVLFNHPLIENIRYGRMSASDEEVKEAARRAHADEFIHQLPAGYSTLVGERGVKLSGGQRQRIAIARAILKDAPVLILDEATSALDSESEKFIQDSLHELMEHKTVIAIAHRLSTIVHLDRLVVMDGGHIIEEGTHRELLARGGLYARLWAMQSGGFIGE